MVKSKLFFLFVALLAMAEAATAETIPVCNKLSQNLRKKKLTLVELTDIALSCHPSTTLAWAQTRTALANLGIAKSAYWPQVSLGSNWTYSSAKAGAGRVDNIPPNPTYNYIYGPSISLSYLLWDFGATRQKVKAADFQAKASQFSENYNFQSVIMAVEQAYYQLLGQKSLVDVYKNSIQENKLNLKTATALRKQGVSTIGDVYQAESGLSQAKFNYQQAEGQLKIYQGQLATSLGIPITTNLKLESLPKKIISKPLMGSIHKLIKIAKETRPDLLAAEAQVRAAAAQLKAAKMAFLPTLNMTNSIVRSYSPQTQVRASNNTAMLSLSIPLFSGLSQVYAVKAASAAETQALALEKQANQAVDSQVWQAYYNLETTEKTLKSSDDVLVSSLQSAKQAFGQYKAGVGNILNVLATRVTAENAQAQAIQAKLNWYIALTQLSEALGQLSAPVNVETLP